MTVGSRGACLNGLGLGKNIISALFCYDFVVVFIVELLLEFLLKIKLIFQFIN